MSLRSFLQGCEEDPVPQKRAFLRADHELAKKGLLISLRSRPFRSGRKEKSVQFQVEKERDRTQIDYQRREFLA